MIEVLYVLCLFVAMMLGIVIVSLVRDTWQVEWRHLSLCWALGFLLTIPFEYLFHKPRWYVVADIIMAALFGSIALFSRNIKEN